MKKKILFTLLIMGILPTIGFSKAKITSENEKYRRNSLCTYFSLYNYVDVYDDNALSRMSDVLNYYEVPDKFDDITVGDRFVNLKNIEAKEEYLKIVDPNWKNKSEKKGGGFLNAVGNALLNTVGSREKHEQYKAEQEAKRKAENMLDFISSHTEVMSASTQEEYDRNTVQTAAKICKYLVDNKIANKLIAKWFNAKGTKINGSYYDLSYIQDRGSYNASELDVMRALESNRKWAILEDAGMELIPNTFITFTEYEIMDSRKYLEKKEQVYELEKKYWAAKNAELDKYSKKNSSESSSKQENKSEKKKGMSLGGFLSSIGIKGTKMTPAEEMEYERRRLENAVGYYVTSTTYLFQLVWNKQIQDIFIRDYWDADVSKLLSSDFFQLRYLGDSRNLVRNNSKYDIKIEAPNETTNNSAQGFLEVLFGKAKDFFDNNNRRSQLTKHEINTILAGQTITQSIDKTFADLQKNHEEFRVKAPLIDVEKDNITAFIGMKEGVTSKTKFEVLEKVFDEKKGTFKYNKVGTLKVDGKRIWDNRFKLIEIEDDNDKKKNKENIDRTYFKGDAGKLAPGMLIRQTK